MDSNETISSFLKFKSQTFVGFKHNILKISIWNLEQNGSAFIHSLSHTLFSRNPRRSQEKFVFTYCNLRGIIFYTFVKFLVRSSDQVWHRLPLKLPCCIQSWIINSVENVVTPTIHSSSKTSQLNRIQSETFMKWTSFGIWWCIWSALWVRLIDFNTHSLQGWRTYHPHLTSNKMMNSMSGSNAMSPDYLSYRLGYISYRFSDRISIINDGRGLGLGRSLLDRHSICSWHQAPASHWSAPLSARLWLAEMLGSLPHSSSRADKYWGKLMAIQQKYLAQKVFTIQQILLAKSLGDLLQFRIITLNIETFRY